jgi:hypothetical protein
VVGGRNFTSAILQKNCHEFIAYENLISAPSSPRRPAERTRTTVADPNLAKAFPLVRRALKVLTDREVSPQLGLLKSTLLQLDSTFTERDYGASTFRDFIEKMAAVGYVNLKQVDRSLLVELKDQSLVEGEEEPAAIVAPAAVPANGQPVETAPVAPSVPSGPTPMQAEEGVRAMQEAFQNSRIAPHWPMYLRNVKQFIKNAIPTFDEHRYGFHSFLEAVRSGQRAGLFRLERNRQGILRVYPGNQIAQGQRPGGNRIEEPAAPAAVIYDVENDPTLQHLHQPPPPVPQPEENIEVQVQPETETEAEAGLEQPIEAEPAESSVEEKPARKRRVSAGIKRKAVAPRKTAGSPAKRASRKKTSPPPEEGSVG